VGKEGEIPTSEPTNDNQEPTVTPKPQGSSLNIDDFIYPGAQVSSKSSSSVNLQSNDDPNSVYSWYQGKVNALHMGAKSIVATKTNGNVNDILDVTGNGSEVKITIIKNSGDSQTTINVTISTSPSTSSGQGNSNSVNNSVNSTNSTTINNNIDTTTDSSNTY
jgi:hypothetical protein